MGKGNVSIFVPHLGCPYQCAFCDQRTISGQQTAPTPQQAAQICEDALAWMGPRAREAEVAFFGGSFTAIEPSYRDALLFAVQPYIGGNGFRGIRISTRPDCIHDAVLDKLKRSGVTAIELGVQSMDDVVLAQNGRGHTAVDTIRASQLIRSYGFKLGHQMMVGLYEDSPQTIWNTAQVLSQLMPDTMRIYPVVVLRGTRLARLYETKAYVPMELDSAVILCSELLRFFRERGIRVIRLGLHASQDIEERLVGGLYHPAFRELCEGRLYLQDMMRSLSRLPQGAYTVCCAPGEVGKVVGHKRENVYRLAQMGYNIKVQASEKIAQFETTVVASDGAGGMQAVKGQE